jgi:hypothetical protein
VDAQDHLHGPFTEEQLDKVDAVFAELAVLGPAIGRMNVPRRCWPLPSAP